ncbi:MAG: tail protein X [Bryobacterales bacterium]|nr:tail protein X [Bryobacterales bacterium]MDE0296961.1 tail protein X [Bryobacterales bacterium]MDE0434055.1 tail protein X [Bryobacterales bacterium]
MTTYRTSEGDIIDAVCRRHYGREAGAVEAVLEANPGLADLGPAPPAGTLVELPDLPRPLETIETVKLWD